MGRPPSNGAPAFRFNHAEVAEMEAVLQENQTMVPSREVLAALAEKFSKTPDRAGKVSVQWKQVWNWFQNRRYALRSKTAKPPGKLTTSPIIRDEVPAVKNATQGPQPSHVPSGRNAPESSHMEFEAKSARDGAWYDVQAFLSHRYLETGDPEVLVRFAGFGSEEDEWINVRRHVRPRSLPCESSECAVVLPGDLILCFQEGKEQALYFDAHVLDAQRRRHDVRGCRCRFLVRYDHDQSEEIVPLRKVCRRPETDYRLQQLNAMNESSSVDALKAASNPASGGTLKPHTSNEAITMPAPNPSPKIGHVVGPVQPQGNASVTGITAAMGASEQKKVESPAASAPLAPSSSEAITTPAANPSLETGHVAVPVRPEGNARFTSEPVATAAPEQKEVESAAASAPLAPTSSEAITTPAENPCLNDGHVAVPVQPQGNTSATSSLPAAMVVPEQQEVESAAASAPLAGSSSVGTSAVLSCDNVKSG